MQTFLSLRAVIWVSRYLTLQLTLSKLQQMLQEADGYKISH